MKKLLVVTLLLSSFVFANNVKLDVELSHQTIEANKDATIFLRVKLTGEKPKNTSKRTPLNVALVLDRSGSMSGEKMSQTIRAAISFVNRLKKEDIVSIITYDDRVSVLLSATKLTNKESVIRKLRAIRVGGSTALHAGVVEGAKQIRKFMDKTRVSRVILLSDGQANVGPHTPQALGQLGQSLLKEGISVTTLGLGDGYNEDLMSKLASKSDGNHKFLRTSNDIEHFFNKELGTMSTIVATDVKIIIEFLDGVTPNRVLDIDAKVLKKSVKAGFNQIYGDHERYMMVELKVPKNEADKIRTLAKVSVVYRNMKNKKMVKNSKMIRVKFAKKAVENKDVMVSAIEQLATIENIRAVKLRDAGRIKEAKRVLRANSAMLKAKSKQYKSKKLEVQSSQNDEAVQNLAPAQWNSQRKMMRDSQTKRSYKGAL